jgi:threonine/homoserine/homoserine lactone efflux protein
MLEYPLIHRLALLTAAVLLNLTPGPDITFILGQTVKGGMQSDFAAVIAVPALAFPAIKWNGSAFIEPPLVLLGSRISNGLHNNQSLTKWHDRAFGAVFVALGVKLATSR